MILLNFIINRHFKIRYFHHSTRFTMVPHFNDKIIEFILRMFGFLWFPLKLKYHVDLYNFMFQLFEFTLKFMVTRPKDAL